MHRGRVRWEDEGRRGRCNDGNPCTTAKRAWPARAPGRRPRRHTCEDGNTARSGIVSGGDLRQGTPRADGEFCVDGDQCTGRTPARQGMRLGAARRLRSGRRRRLRRQGADCGCDETDPREVCVLPKPARRQGRGVETKRVVRSGTPGRRKKGAGSTDDACTTTGQCAGRGRGQRCRRARSETSARSTATATRIRTLPADVNLGGRPDLARSTQAWGRVDLSAFPTVTPCSSKYDVTLDPTHRTNRVRLKAVGTANGRVRRERDRFRIYPVRP